MRPAASNATTPLRGGRRALGRGRQLAAAGLATLVACVAWARARPAFLRSPSLAGGAWALAGSRHGRTGRRAIVVNEAEYVEVWDQDVRELALDVRELLVTDANIFFIGPDIDTYLDPIREVARLLNFTYRSFDYDGLTNATDIIDVTESVFSVPPLNSIRRWSWAIFRHGLVVWIDPDGYKMLDIYERDRIHKLKFPKKKQPFGPAKPPPLMAPQLAPELAPPADPIDMWMEADVHVDLQARPDMPVTNLLLAHIIEAILANPPKWRGWMRQAKTRGTIPADYQTPLQVRRSFHSYGMSPRLNRLLKA